MDSFEKKLEEYRAHQKRKKFVDKVKTTFKSIMNYGIYEKETTDVKIPIPAQSKQDLNDIEDEDDDVDPFSSDEEESEDSREIQDSGPKKSNWLKYTLWIVYFFFWATCFAIAIELKFGLVFLMFSALFGIYFNTRTTPKKRNEVSAYSVFNKDCKAIDGSIKAEQFENEIRHGFSSVR